MKRIFKSVLYIGIILLVFTAGCEYNAAETGAYSFLVMSSGDVVTGYYIENGDPNTRRTYETVQVDGSTYYEFKKNLVSPASIRIFADQLVGSAAITSVQIYVYENSEEVANVSDGISADGDTVSATLYWNFTTSNSSSK